ncbi:MAG: hypothetical protein JWO62_770 [Acidimicrobiaceae bacterium]|nr:hypothetical protein [Acidimicrobiaceae bacterium]
MGSSSAYEAHRLNPKRLPELTRAPSPTTLAPVTSPADRSVATPSPFRPNAFGLGEALVGLAAGFVLATVFTSVFGALSHHPRSPSGYGSDVASLLGLWIGLVGGAIAASVRNRRYERARDRSATEPARDLVQANGAVVPVTTRDLLARDYGFAIKLWPDVPLGIVVGLASQYLLVPLLELPLLPFVPHLFHRLSQPAVSLTGDASGPGLVVLGVLVCLGSPLVEELYFRGLLLRALAARLAPRGARFGPVLSVVLVGLVFGLVHFEPLELIALAGFGMVLSVLAWRTGRLGPGIVAHMAFNTATFVSVARSH